LEEGKSRLFAETPQEGHARLGISRRRKSEAVTLKFASSFEFERKSGAKKELRNKARRLEAE